MQRQPAPIEVMKSWFCRFQQRIDTYDMMPMLADDSSIYYVAIDRIKCEVETICLSTTN